MQKSHVVVHRNGMARAKKIKTMITIQLCLCKNYNQTNKRDILFLGLPSAWRKIPIVPYFSVLTPSSTLIIDLFVLFNSSFMNACSSSEDWEPAVIPTLFTQSELNFQVRDLDLTNDSAHLFGSRLSSKNFLSSYVFCLRMLSPSIKAVHVLLCLRWPSCSGY